MSLIKSTNINCETTSVVNCAYNGIIPVNIRNCTLISENNEWIGNIGIEPNITLKYNDNVLIKNQDYEIVSYDWNTNIDYGTIIVRGIGEKYFGRWKFNFDVQIATRYEITTDSIYSGTFNNLGLQFTQLNNTTVTIRFLYDNIVEYCEENTEIYLPSKRTIKIDISNNIKAIKFCNNVSYSKLFSRVIKYGSNVDSLLDHTFQYSEQREYLLPNNITVIPEYCFSNCVYLEDFTIPDTVTDINKHAFLNTSLKKIYIPKNVSNIDTRVVDTPDIRTFPIESLTRIEVDNQNPFYDSRNDCNAIIDKSNNKLIVGCINTIIPSGVTSIGSCAFFKCQILNIQIPSSVKTIGSFAFFGCNLLKNIELSNMITYINECAFENCTSLTKITLPIKLMNISYSTFSGCTNLQQIVSKKSEAPTIQSNCFGNSTSNYTGRNYYSAGTNKLITSKDSTGYNEGYWLDPLQSKDKCGFYNYCDDVSTYDVINIDTQYPYINSQIKPVPILQNSLNKQLIVNVDYSTSYGENTVVGTNSGSITVTGNDPFINTKTVNFNIISTTGSIFEIKITDQQKQFGFYSLTRLSTSKNIEIRWGDGSVSTISGNVSRLYHTYNYPGTYIVTVNDNVKSLTVSYSSSTYYQYCRYTLKKIHQIGSNVTALGANAFRYCEELESVELPSSIRTISSFIFANCTKLQSVDLSNISATKYGPSMFFNSGLKSIVFSNTIGSFSTGMFRSCKNLTEIDIPSVITNLGSYTFGGCNKLTKIIFHSQNAPTASSSTFGTTSTIASANLYTGYDTRLDGTNVIIVPKENNNYNQGYYSQYLLSTDCCGFHIETAQ